VALNLWKIGGKPTSYNPLPTGYVNGVSLEIGDYVISFNAKSSSSGSLMLDRASQTGDTVISLTPDLKKYTVSLNIPTKQSLFLYSQGGATDIIIDSIELVQKPMPKLTVNGVDGFASGKWSLNSNATVVDDSTLNFTGAADWQGNLLSLNLLPNTTYSLSFSQQTGNFWVDSFNGSNVKTNIVSTAIGTYGAKSAIFTTRSDTARVEIGLSNGTLRTPVVFSNVMLNLGSTPAPYSRKTGDKMVLPVAKSKNKFDGQLESGVYGGGGTKVVLSGFSRGINSQKVSPNTSYTISMVDNILDRISYYDINGNFISQELHSSESVKVKSLTTPSNCYYVTFCFVGTSLTDLVQFEEGTSATAYTPYAVQVNDLAKRYVPKKNFVSNAQGDWEIGSGDPNSNGDTTRIRMKNRFDVKVGNSYMISWNSTLYDVYLFESTGGAPLGWYMTSPVTFSAVSPQYRAVLRRKDLGQMSVSEINNVNIQIEQGYVATSYEPYTQLIPKARTGLKLNGTSDYGLVPSASFVTPANFTVYVDAYVNSYVPYPSLSNSFLRRENSFILQWNSTGQLKPHVYVGGAWRIALSSTNVVKAGYRYRLAMTYDGTSLVGYVDGVEVCRTTWIGSAESPNTDLYLFKSPTGGENLDGTVYSTKIFSRVLSASELASLNNNTALLGDVLDYNFEKPSNIVGSTLFQNAQNLIPSFEDTRWILHANTQVFGKDVLRLNASANFQYSYFDVFVNPSTSYTLQCDKLTGQLGSYLSYSFIDSGGSFGTVNNVYASPRSIITSSNTQKIRIYLTNGGLGSFDFIKPQLYALSGTEGTIYGTPTSARKQSRRTQYAKR
jgi:hypothetical protein